MTAAADGADTRFRDAFGDWTPRAVAFDCDGVLLDTESVWQRVQGEMLERLGASLEPGDEDDLHGASLEDAVEVIAERAGADYGTVLEDTRDLFTEHLRRDDLRVMPGAAAVVEAVSRRVPAACASNSWHEALEEKLTRTGLRDCFSSLQSTDTVEHGKPDPAMYAAAARALAAEPEHTLAFEDSGTGARSALGAGLRLIAVPEDGSPIPGAALQLDSLADPGLLAWIETWPTTR